MHHMVSIDGRPFDSYILRYIKSFNRRTAFGILFFCSNELYSDAAEVRNHELLAMTEMLVCEMQPEMLVCVNLLTAAYVVTSKCTRLYYFADASLNLPQFGPFAESCLYCNAYPVLLCA